MKGYVPQRKTPRNYIPECPDCGAKLSPKNDKHWNCSCGYDSEFPWTAVIEQPVKEINDY